MITTLAYLLLPVLAIIWFVRYIYSYWERKGFPSIKPTIPSGNLTEFVKGRTSFGLAVYDIYKSTAEPFIGIYLFFRPALLVRDAELCKRILTTDFNHFVDRGVHSNEKTDPLSGNLFSLTGDKWKTMRAKLSPTFTSGKLKNMFSTVENVADSMLDYLREEIPREGKVIDIRKLATMYATDIIGSTFFGIDVNTFKEPDNYFANLRNVFTPKNFFEAFRVATAFLCPQLCEIVTRFGPKDPSLDAIVDIVKRTFDFREKSGMVRKDFMQLLLQLRNTGRIMEDGNWSAEEVKGGQKSLTIEECAAQAAIFYVAGLETTAAAITFCLYELGHNENVTDKLVTDINETLAKHNGQLTYDCIQDMKYLELCVLETLRKYPGLPLLSRECTQSYQIPDSKYTIEPGTMIVLSLMGLQRDPAYFPDPLSFIPERFAAHTNTNDVDGNDHNIRYTEAANLPFGEGPRKCIGLRQGKLSVKVALVKILTAFKLESIGQKELEFDFKSAGLLPKDGANIMLKKIE